MPPLTLSVLGQFQATVDQQPISRFATDKIRALLVYLAVEADRPHRRDALATLLWPDYPSRDALRNLRQSLYRLRQTLDKAAPEISQNLLTVDRQSVILHSQFVDTDLSRFYQAIRLATSHPHDELATCQPCQQQLQQAVELYRGDFLLGFGVDDAEGFTEWQAVQTERAHQQALATLDNLAAASEGRGDLPSLQQFAARQIALEPWREKAHRQLMRAFARQGARSEALAQFERCRELLATELAVEVSPETTQLYRQIRSGQLLAAEPLADAPPKTDPATAAGSVSRLHNFPQLFTPFLGRETELEQIRHYLQATPCRMLTLTGPGGSGKTRLAIQAARALLTDGQAYADGIHYVPLATVASAELILSACVSSLNLSLSEGASPRETVLNYLRARSLLLVFDNFEHLQDGAGVLAELLAEAPHTRMLVTSRVPLHLSMEQRLPVEGLRYTTGTNGPEQSRPPGESPAPNALSAVQLFLQAARQVRPDFDPTPAETAAILHICRALQGMPLALEIAATWTRLMDCQAIAQEIGHSLDFLVSPARDAPERHRSVRAVFEHTWRLLTPEERTALAQASVFRGSFTLDAVLKITDGTVVDVANLLDWALLQRGPQQRYLLHELVRQFAAEQLAARPPETALAAAQRHSRYYLEHLAALAESLFTDRHQAVRADFQSALDNLRRAWDWACRHREFGLLQKGAHALGQFFVLEGLLEEGERLYAQAAAQAAGPDSAEPGQAALLSQLRAQQAVLLSVQGKLREAAAAAEEAVRRLPAACSPRLRAQALNTQGEVCTMQGAYDDALAIFGQALAACQQAQEQQGQARAMSGIGQIYWQRADYKQALSYQRQALAIDRERGQRWGMARSLSRMGLVHYRQGEYEQALACHREALEITEHLGDRTGIARHLSNLGVVYSDQARLADASACYEQALAIDRELGNRLGVAIRQTNLGMIYMRQGELSRALQATQEAFEILTRIGHRSGIALTDGNIGVILWRMGEFDRALAHDLRALALDEELGNQDCVARHLGNIGVVYKDKGEYETALAWYERAVALLRTLNRPYYLCQTLVRKADVCLRLGSAAKAERLLEEGLSLSEEIGRQDAITEGRILAARLAAKKGDPAAARQLLDALLAESRAGDERAEILYEIWQLSQDPADRERALDAFRTLLATGATRFLSRRVAELASPAGGRAEPDG